MIRDIVVVITCFTAAVTSVFVASAEIDRARIEAFEASLPGPLLNDPFDGVWDFVGDGYKAKSVSDPKIPGQSAMRVRVYEPGEKSWLPRIVLPIEGAVEAGDTVMVAMYVRAKKLGRGVDNARVISRLKSVHAEPYRAFLDADFEPQKDWHIHYFGGKVKESVAPGELELNINLGLVDQTLEFGMVLVMNLGPDAPRDAIPSAPSPVG